MITEADVVRVFRAAGNLGWKYRISLPGEADILVPMSGPSGEMDFRVSDTEHVIHELAHCCLLGVELGDPSTLLGRLSSDMRKYPKHIQQINEIETFSVTLEVLRQIGVEPEVDTFMNALEDIQLDDFHVPGFGVREYVDVFHTTLRGTAAVNKIVTLFRGEGA